MGGVTGRMAERDLVLSGGGHAQVAGRPTPGWRVTLLTRALHSPDSGMRPGIAAGPYRPEEGGA
jgi:selenide,water dikinase